MSEMEPDNILEQARGRSRYLRDLGGVKTPDLLDRLLAENARLKEALTPLADAADGYEDWAPDDQGCAGLTLADARRARAAMGGEPS